MQVVANVAMENIQLKCNVLILRSQYLVSAEVQILLAVCQRFRIVATFDNSLVILAMEIRFKALSSANHFTKTIRHHYHRKVS